MFASHLVIRRSQHPTSVSGVRLGDLIGLLNVYFECAWLANFGNHWDEALENETFSSLERLDIDMTNTVVMTGPK